MSANDVSSAGAALFEWEKVRVLHRNQNDDVMVYSGDLILLKPYFIGSIANGTELRNTYDAANVGHIQLNRIVFQESIL